MGWFGKNDDSDAADARLRAALSSIIDPRTSKEAMAPPKPEPLVSPA